MCTILSIVIDNIFSIFSINLLYQSNDACKELLTCREDVSVMCFPKLGICLLIWVVFIWNLIQETLVADTGLGCNRFFCCSFIMLCGNDFCPWCSCKYEVLWVSCVRCFWVARCCNWFEDNAKSIHLSNFKIKAMLIWHYALKVVILHGWGWQVKIFLISWAFFFFLPFLSSMSPSKILSIFR